MKGKLLASMMAAMLVAAVGLAGCSQGASSETQTTSNASSEATASSERTITDLSGNSIVLPNVIDSVVVPFPAATQTVLGLGAADLLTGGYILNTDMNKAMFGKYMDAITLIRPNDLNKEVVLGCDPDFAVLASPSQMEVLEGTDIPLLLYKTSNFDELVASVQMVADAIGTDKAAENAKAYKEFYQKLESKVSSQTKDIPESAKPVVYVCTEDDGLSSHGKGGAINSWVTLCGGKYLCDVLGVEGGEVSLTAEQIIEGNPDIIICVTTAGRDAILNNPAFAELSAVKNGKVYVNPMGGSVWFKSHFEMPLELTWAPLIISPDYVTDLDTRSYVDEFYKTFYGYTVTDEDYETIMNPPVGSR
ncbi:ABC transporter substrate-binding protein [Adlercreutzia sp. ZJ473]|uniref:ABC transporter substrate-binding protein n=1 Tax=Adlercreutzia sp. ZJ473 TaxID=2722822 RepID=UPI001554A187|nr:ABC transporter substrate-binding protein [Adlercreutzia sp. ZJ473]